MRFEAFWGFLWVIFRSARPPPAAPGRSWKSHCEERAQLSRGCSVTLGKERAPRSPHHCPLFLPPPGEVFLFPSPSQPGRKTGGKKIFKKMIKSGGVFGGVCAPFSSRDRSRQMEPSPAERGFPALFIFFIFYFIFLCSAKASPVRSSGINQISSWTAFGGGIKKEKKTPGTIGDQ